MSIRALRQALRMSQGRFARRLGVNQSTVSRWESGSVAVPSRAMEQVATLAHEADLDIDWGLLLRVRRSAAPTLLATLDLTVVEVSETLVALAGRDRRAMLGRTYKPFLTPAVEQAHARTTAESGFLAGPLVGLDFVGRINLFEYRNLLARNLWALAFSGGQNPAFDLGNLRII